MHRPALARLLALVKAAGLQVGGRCVRGREDLLLYALRASAPGAGLQAWSGSSQRALVTFSPSEENFLV